MNYVRGVAGSDVEVFERFLESGRLRNFRPSFRMDEEDDSAPIIIVKPANVTFSCNEPSKNFALSVLIFLQICDRNCQLLR